ncbi:hypothetical protein A3K73_04160 [Candidatus Pacearchaeota archaeon RBG_13_36_9]|nr:MAG: hypothetical protein A3K73_04160 [Candidatus Pacearchaeota archaeon RBG_13_36_9]
MNKEEFLRKLETEFKISKSSAYTIRNYVASNTALLEFSKKAPEALSLDDVKLYIAEHLTEKSPSSLALFLAAIKYAHSKIFSRDITAGIKRPKKDKKMPAVLSKEEVKMLLSSITNSKSRLMTSLLYACGFRVSELVNLKIQDLDFNNKVGHVKHAQGKKDGIFNMPEFLIPALMQRAEKQKSFNQEYLFTGPKGRLSSRNVQKIVKKAAKKAGLQKPVSPYTLRHSFATHLLENGNDIRMIQTLLGHSSLYTTEIYAHISTEQIRKVKSPIDSLMKN